MTNYFLDKTVSTCMTVILASVCPNIIAAVPGYGVAYDNSGFTNVELEYFPDILNPASMQVVGTMNPAEGFFCGDFMGEEYATIYALDILLEDLFEIDTSDGSTTYVGHAETPGFFEIWTGMASTPDGSEMFATTTTITNSYLWKIDTTTGANALIGQINGAGNFYDIAFKGDGTLYGMNNLNLYIIDPATGAPTTICALPFNQVIACDFDPATDELYVTTHHNGQEIYHLNINDCTATLVGTLPVPGGTSMGSLALMLPQATPTPGPNTPTPLVSTPTPGPATPTVAPPIIPATQSVGLGIVIFVISCLIGTRTIRKS